jgi:hypothetical protein
MDDEYDFLELPTPATAYPSTSKHKIPYHQQQLQNPTPESNTGPGPIWSFLIPTASSLVTALVVVVALQLNTISLPSTKWVVDVDKCTCDCWDRAFKVPFDFDSFTPRNRLRRETMATEDISMSTSR